MTATDSFFRSRWIDAPGNVRAATTDYQTSISKVFSSGDMRRGQSLVVWAISEGRKAAVAVDRFLAQNEEPIQPVHRARA